jgi:hypothetical protein
MTGASSWAKIGIKLATSVCALAWSASASPPRPNWCPVSVSLSSQVQLPPALVRDGEGAASTIFARIRVPVVWSDPGQQASNALAACGGESATRNLAVEIVPHAPNGFSHIALAMAMPYANSGIRIVIFFDRVNPLLRGHDAPQATVLGYVLAHEIGHVLQGVAHHSELGIMRARWLDNDFKQMGTGVLTFTSEDIQLIQRSLIPRESSTRSADPLNAER